MAYYLTYQYTWIAYLLAALGMYYCVVKFTKYWVHLDLRSYARLFSAVILFTPASQTVDGSSSIAPAFIIALGELLTHGVKASMQGLVPILFALFVGALLLAIQAFIKANRAS